MLRTRPSRSDPRRGAEVLFQEAHQRRRRRRRILAAVAAAVIAAAAGTFAALSAGGSHAQAPKPTPTASPPRNELGPPPLLAWTDYQGQVRIESLQTHQLRVIASKAGDVTTPLVVSGKTLFWIATGELPLDTVMAYDSATGHLRTFAAGVQVFNAVGSSDVYVDDGNNATVARYRLDGRLVRRFSLPTGWYLPNKHGFGAGQLAVAHGGILVQSQTTLGEASPGNRVPLKVGVWTPATGHVRPLGEGWQVVATYTDPHGSNSVLAWFPPNCLATNNCPLELTDLPSGATRKVSNPLGFGFDFGGAFSVHGLQLAAFAKTNAGIYNPQTRLALIDVTTGSLRLVSGATVAIGEAVGWAQWLPDGAHLIAGGVCGGVESQLTQPNCYLADARTGKATPLGIPGTWDQDVNYSTVVLRGQ